MNEVMEVIFSILATAFDMIITIMFFKTCMKKRSSMINGILFYAIFIGAFALDLALSQFGAAGIFYAVKSLVIYNVLSLLYETKWTTRMFTSISFLVFQMMSEVISYFIVVSTIHNSSEANMRSYSIMLSKLIIFIITVVVMLIMKKKGSDSIRSKDYLFFIVTPVISMAVIIAISFEFDTGEPTATVGTCLASAGLMIINLIVYYLLENIIEVSSIREHQHQMEQQFVFQEKKYEQTSASFKSIYGVIHDTNKHFLYLKECIRNGSYEEADNYIESAIDHLDKSYKRVITGYLPIDALVSNALNIAANNNIDFKTNINVDKDAITIERYDICVALGNLLDNAVEACKKVDNPDDRYISISIVTKDGDIVIHIQNSAERMTSNCFETEKNDAIYHGYGINNIIAISEKYGGVFNIERNESSCEATLFLPL